jgi:aminopeptidase N
LDNSQDLPTRKWWIPLNYATKLSPDFSQTKPDTWMHDNFDQAILGISLPDDVWIIFNKQATGYYRVNYDYRLWELITEEMVRGDHAKIPVLNRAQLLDDSFNIARTGDIKFDIALGLLEYLPKELDYAPWVPADRAFTMLNQRMASLHDYSNFLTFVLNVVSPLFDRLGVTNIENEPYFDRLARNVAIKWACYAGSGQCRTITHRLLDEYINGTNLLRPDTRAPVLCAGILTADEPLYWRMWDRMNETSDANERVLLIDALACSQDDRLLSIFLASVINRPNAYTPMEKTRIMTQVANNGHLGAKTVLNFITNAVIDEVELGSSINNMFNWITDVDEYRRVSRFN